MRFVDHDHALCLQPMFVALFNLSEMIKSAAVQERYESDKDADTDEGHCGSSSILEDFFMTVKNLLIAFP